MPYYKEKKALAPLHSDIITHERIERFLQMQTTGFSTGLTGLVCSVRNKEVLNYEGFYIPKSIQIHHKDKNTPVFHICVLDSALDARINHPSEEKSPWVNNPPASIEDIEAYWQPLTDPALLTEMATLFAQAEEHAKNHFYSDLTDEDKLATVKRYDVDLPTLDAFCRTLGRNTKETAKHIEDHVIFAAHNPHNYLKTNNLLKEITHEDCQGFTWKQTLTGKESHFKQNWYLCEIDWKAEAEDVAWNINQLLKTLSPNNPQSIELHNDDENHLTDYWLEQAAPLLKKMGWQIIFVDNIGDSYIFTLMEPDKVKDFIKTGKFLGLETSAHKTEKPNLLGKILRKIN